MEMQDKAKNGERLKSWLFGLAAFLLISYSIYFILFRVTNEIGWLGADKDGRQVFIQSINKSSSSIGIHVDSDYNSHSFLERFIIGEPMRTVIRFDIKNDDANRFALHDHLTMPYTNITDQYQGKITLQDGLEISKDELIKILEKHDAQTVEDYYSGLGFKRIELYTNGNFTSAQEIKGSKNTYNIGGD